MRKSERQQWARLAEQLKANREANKPTPCNYCVAIEPRRALVPTKRGPLMHRKCAAQAGQLIGS